jgi:hypothetical protein
MHQKKIVGFFQKKCVMVTLDMGPVRGDEIFRMIKS